MKLKVIGSGSAGNAYVLGNDQESILLECGVRFKDIKRALDFDLSKVHACLVTHEHKDHNLSAREVLDAGIPIWATPGTHLASGTKTHHRAFIMDLKTQYVVGGFKIMAFHVKHDAKDPCGFLINHKEIGNTIFMTDTFYCPYTFENLHNIIIEANYSREIMIEKLGEMQFLRDRIMQSHMSLETCLKFLDANDLSQVNNIILIHLSDGNSNEKQFKEKVEEASGKTVTVASNGLEMELNKTPF